MIVEARKCQCGTPFTSHPHTKGGQDNSVCPNCDVVQPIEHEKGNSARKKTKLDKKFDAVMKERAKEWYGA